ncbi:MAG: GNAT family N-acetyltransferase [Ruminococcus sp.]|nr:GNAT family N-acetyltransferase [Ruminococcus sp.]
MKIRNAQSKDLKMVAVIEKICFSKEEAATEKALSDRIKSFPKHFWLLENDDSDLIGEINGMVTNEPDLKDEMYHNAYLHDEEGEWQMIFSVAVLPEFQRKGYASLLMKRMLEDVKADGRKGVVLTCKAELVSFYECFGFKNEGISVSQHADVVWYQMRRIF